MQEKAKTEVISSEELMYEISEVNKRIQKRVQRSLPAQERETRNRPRLQDLCSTVALSMDVKALYPSITVQLAYETMIKVVKKSELPWEHIDIVTLGRFLAVTVQRSELKKYEIDECVPVPKPRTTFNSWVNPSKRVKATNGDCQFQNKPRDPTPKEAQVMLALALATTVKTTMMNHFYTFGGTIHRQVDGSAIGSDLSGEIARNEMGNWDTRFLTVLKSLGIIVDLYSR